MNILFYEAPYGRSMSAIHAYELASNLRKLGHRTKAFEQGDEVSMGEEKIRMIAQSQKGAALRVEGGLLRSMI